jgi:lipoic acid synthetase|tara:strand:+ start:914 stop:1894 length:981 start_codon:yes stop_codon:yes gene_type:complete
VVIENEKLGNLSGEKYTNQFGITAIKDGMKKTSDASLNSRLRKPEWLKVQLPTGKHYKTLLQDVKAHGLNTVCQESKCPNIGECWNRSTATLMILGNICTRACRFCAVDTGNPKGWIDPLEPNNVAETVSLMALDYVVLTSVDRDDLPDGGARHIAHCVTQTKAKNPKVLIEVLSPDFSGSTASLDVLLQSTLDVFSHNIETVKRLTSLVRDPRASYHQSLDVLMHAYENNIITKSGMMLGLGETDDEIITTLRDLRSVGVSLMTLGQYLQPTKYHLDVARFVSPVEFNRYKEIGLGMGFKEIVAGPLVRSSYRAEQSFLNLLNQI